MSTPNNPYTLLDSFLGSLRAPATRAAYRSDIADFARHYGHADPAAAAAHVASLDEGEVGERVGDYLRALSERGAAPSTVTRRMAAMRALVTFASNGKRSDLVAPAPSVAAAQHHWPVLSPMQIRCLLTLPDTSTLRGIRDSAILRLMCENALRSVEICTARVGDYSQTERTLSVPTCARGVRVIHASARCAMVLGEYLRRSGHISEPSAPLFRNLDHRTQGRVAGLTGKGLRHILTGYGRQIDVDLTPLVLRRSVQAIVSTLVAAYTVPPLSPVDTLDLSGEKRGSTMGDDREAQIAITQALSDEMSDPRRLREDAARLRERSRRLIEKAAALNQRTDWLQRKSQAIEARLLAHAQRWSATGFVHASGRTGLSECTTANPPSPPEE